MTLHGINQMQKPNLQYNGFKYTHESIIWAKKKQR